MAAKQTLRKTQHQKSKASPPPVYAALAVARQNLINMVAVTAVSGTVLLGLLAAKHF